MSSLDSMVLPLLAFLTQAWVSHLYLSSEGRGTSRVSLEKPGAVGSLSSGREEYQAQGFSQGKMVDDMLSDLVSLLSRDTPSQVPLSSTMASSMREAVGLYRTSTWLVSQSTMAPL